MELDDVFRALADGTRRSILELLLTPSEDHGGEWVQRDLHDYFELSQPALSQHLRILCDAGLVLRRQEGRFVHYRLAKDALEPLVDWAAPFQAFWGGRLEALGDYLRRTS